MDYFDMLNDCTKDVFSRSFYDITLNFLLKPGNSPINLQTEYHRYLSVQSTIVQMVSIDFIVKPITF